ncbi:unnamed protein product, partial [Rotaria magnacalcarata]
MNDKPNYGQQTASYVPPNSNHYSPTNNYPSVNSYPPMDNYPP